jgi:hypothetical protein
MTIDQNLKNHLISLLSRIPDITSVVLSEELRNKWIEDLAQAYDEPEKLPFAWSPILKAINESYCLGKFDHSKYGIICKNSDLI